MTTTKVFPQMRGVNSKLASLQASTRELSLEEKKSLLESLERDVSAATTKADAPKRRLEAIQAAAISTNSRTKDAFVTANKGLQSLGFALDAIAASGNVADVEEEMREHKWTSIQIIGLKTALARIGAIS